MIEEKKYYVYEWFIKDTNEVFYVGKGCGERYKTVARRNKFFQDMYQSHDCDVRKVFVDLTEAEAFNREKQLIKYYRDYTDYRLTNVTDGGEGSSGYVMPDDVKQKISEASKQKWQDPDFRDRMTQLRSSEDSPYQSSEFREKISKLVKGENNPNFGNHWNEDQKNHLSQVRITSGIAKGDKNPRAKKIICLETGEVFKTISDAQTKYGVRNITSFSCALRERFRTAAKLHWMEYDDRLNDDEVRFKELLISLSQSEKPSFICIETKELFFTKKQLLNSLHIGVKVFNKNYSDKYGITINNQTYILVENYLGRLIQ